MEKNGGLFLHPGPVCCVAQVSSMTRLRGAPCYGTRTVSLAAPPPFPLNVGLSLFIFLKEIILF